MEWNGESVEIQTDSSGMIRGFPHHDGTLTAIEFLSEGIIAIRTKSGEGREFTIRLEGVLYFVANDIWEGNCIDSIFVWDALQAPKSTMQTLFTKRQLGPYSEGNSVDLKQRLVFEISSSIGACVIALCRQLRVLGHP